MKAGASAVQPLWTERRTERAPFPVVAFPHYQSTCMQRCAKLPEQGTDPGCGAGRAVSRQDTHPERRAPREE
ncbi:UNVERIFIED_CONTAM: hypothetical protein HHA_454040 [Hammondia hammondi]|eukprot:XP_008887445.1 hypothetical protein HHA_454040 [Hammondia hammondi]